MSGRFGVQSLVLFVALCCYPLIGSGQEISKSAVNKAHEFLISGKTGKQINNIMHMGTTYSGHEVLGVSRVRDSRGNVIPGEFAIEYRFWWDEKYSTDLLVFCTPSGSIDSIRAGRSDGIAQAPFLMSQATVSLIGEALYETFRDQMSTDEKRNLRLIIDKSDTKSLLEMQLKLQQAVGAN